MSRIRLYFDEDAMQTALVVALRARRIDILTARDCGMVGRSDEDHLRHAAGDGRVLYSFNIKDYSLLHAHWISTGRQHSGIVLAFQQRYSIGEQLRRLLHLLNRTATEEMLSRLEYLVRAGDAERHEKEAYWQSVCQPAHRLAAAAFPERSPDPAGHRERSGCQAHRRGVLDDCAPRTSGGKVELSYAAAV